MVLSIEERVFLVEYVFREGDRYTDLVQEQFAEKFPETPVPHRSVDAERSGRSSKLNDKKLMDISDCMLRSPSKLLCKLAQEKDIGFATAHKVLREKMNLFPYKVTVVQELKPADHEKRHL
jgi:hypothetical protein